MLEKERARWEEEKKSLLKDIGDHDKVEMKSKTHPEESSISKSQNECISHLNFSQYAGSSLLIDGSIVHFESLGRGRPVIFLHGWIGSWQYWLSSMQVVSRTFRAYALDLWGFGGTSHNIIKYSLDEQVKLLDSFLSELGIGKIAIVGHGLGALVGMKFATRYRESVDRVMAVSCPVSFDAVNPRLRTVHPQELADWLSNKTPEAMTALSDAPKTDMKAIAESMVDLQSENYFGSFRDLNVPCLLAYGDKDQAITIPSSDIVTSTFMYQCVFEKSGHFPMIDESSRFEKLLMEFLFLDSGVSPGELRLPL